MFNFCGSHMNKRPSCKLFSNLGQMQSELGSGLCSLGPKSKDTQFIFLSLAPLRGLGPGAGIASRSVVSPLI